jgi:hypothetical protein
MSDKGTKRLGIVLAMALCAGAAWGQERVPEGLRADEMSDLSAVSLESSIPYPVPGEAVEVRIGVRNNARVPAGKVEVRLLVDGKAIGTGTLDLAAGETGILRLPWTPAVEKTYALTAVIDPAQRRPERDRLDDTATAEVVVAAKPAGKPPAPPPEKALPQKDVRAERDLLRVAVVPFDTPVAPVATVGRWVSIGPRHINEGLGAVGVLFSVAVDPASPATLYVGSHGSGVWKTTDGGASWNPITDSLPTLKIAALAVDPAQTSRVYVATPDFGVFRSENGGASWNQVSGAAQLNLSDCCDTLLVDPVHAGGLYLTSFDGIYHSTNSGATWTLSLRAGAATSLVLDSTGAGTLYASLQGSTILSPKGIYRAALGGDAWTALGGCPGGALPAFDSTTKITLAVSGGTLFAAFKTSMSFQVARTTGASCQTGTQQGLQWMALWTAPSGAPPVLWNSIYADPVDPRFVYVTGTDFWSSTDGGVTFTQRSGPHSDHHAFAAAPGAPGTFYVGCDGGIYQSTDHGANGSWRFLGDGISNFEFYDIASSASEANLVIGGSQDNGTEKYDGSSTVWAWIKDGDGGSVAIDPTHPQILYGIQQNAPSVARSTDGGGSWTGIADGLPTGAVCFNLQWYPDPAVPSTLIAACNESLWRTTQAGTPWSAILTVSPDSVVRSTVDPSIDLYYAGTSLGKVFAGPVGASWQQVFAHPGGRGVTDLEVDPDDKATLYASFSGTGSGRIYRLRRDSPAPQTMSAVDITADLPSALPVRTMAVDRMAPWTIYAGTNAGVFRGNSSDGATWRWTPYNDGLPPGVLISKLEVQPKSGVLRAGTYGRSAYEVNTDFPLGSLVAIEGRITLLRLENVGTGYGPPTDSLDVEAVVWLDTAPGRAFGFQLRTGAAEGDHTGMLDLLRDAFEEDRPVRIDYTRTGLRNGTILRVADVP